MNNLKQSLVLLSAVTLPLMLSGCLESGNVVFFEPGVYQGASDPLVDGADASALEQRFANQMDR